MAEMIANANTRARVCVRGENGQFVRFRNEQNVRFPAALVADQIERNGE